MRLGADASWTLVQAAARAAERLERAADAARLDDALEWQPRSGWINTLPREDPRSAILDLYLPVASATTTRPITVAHLGESLDGFIATHTGDSQWVTGHENLLHMHRLRALSDAVIVGPGTVAADDPLLTTRLVDGPNPLRVVLDPARRLGTQYRVFSDRAAETLYVCAASLVRPGEQRVGAAAVVGISETADGLDLVALMADLRRRGCARVFIEGGGVTVSKFLAANLLDRLHVTVAPLLIGDGRPAIRLPGPAALDQCHRPAYRVFRMGGDVLFDCDLRAHGADAPRDPIDASVSRVI